MNNTEPRDLSDQIGRVPRITPRQRDAARRATAAAAHDADDLRLLLDMLGIGATA